MSHFDFISFSDMKIIGQMKSSIIFFRKFEKKCAGVENT